MKAIGIAALTAIIYHISFGSAAQAQTPSINSVSPASPIGSNSAQPFTIHGTNYTASSVVNLRNITTGAVFLNRPISSRTSTQLVINPVFGTEAHTWSVEVVNGAASSGQFQFQVQSPAGAPTISSVTPASPIGSTSAQSFAIHGTNYTSSSVVNLRNITTGVAFLNRAISSQTSTQLVINPVFGTEAHTWSVEVVNGSASSGQFQFQVQSPTVTPTISSVSPASPIGSTSAQSFAIHGTNYTASSVVNLRNITTGVAFLNRPISSRTSTQLVINPVFGTEAHTWSVEVVNGSASSGQFQFQVQSPAGAPTISSVTPASPIGSTSAQSFAIHGTNYTASSVVNLRNITTGVAFLNRPISSQTSTQLVINPVFGTEAHTWSVEVVNGTASSGQFQFQVQSPAATPTISSVTPASPVGSNSAQSFTIHGTNYTSSSVVNLRNITTGAVFLNRAISSQTSTQLVINPVFGTEAHTWSVEVVNGAASSGQFQFQVQSPNPSPTPTPTPPVTPTPGPGGPTISSVSPNPVPGSTVSQPFTINGSGFLASSVVNLRNITTGASFPNRTISSQTSTRLIINPIFGTEAHTWSVEVVNATVFSGQYQFEVHAPAPVFQPDLVPSNVQVTPASVLIGDSINVTLTIANHGAGNAIASTTRVRINSSATSTSANDIVLGDIATPAIAAGSSVSRPGSFIIPPGVPSGTNYVWVSVDNTNVTNQSDGTNDYGHSPGVAVATSTVAAPVILNLTGNQTVNQGEVATFSVFASGSSPLSYQWRRNTSQIVYSASSSLTTGQAGTYTVDVSNAGGTTRSNPTTLTVSGSTPPVIIPTGGALITYPNGSTFDPALPTVVITHGWQPTGNYNTGDPALPWQKDVAGAIRDRLGPNQVNVLLFAWPEAYTILPLSALVATASEGSQLAIALQAFWGPSYQQRIQFIGHSFGTVANAIAVRKLSQHIDQVSLLDAPINVRLGNVPLLRTDIDILFRYLLRRDRVDYVDSYIADDSYFGFTFGGFIAGAAPSGGLHLSRNHPGVHDYYLDTTGNASLTLGFNCSVLVPPNEWQPLDRWNPPLTLLELFAHFTDAISAVFGDVVQGIDSVRGTLRDVFRLHSPGSLHPAVNVFHSQAEVSSGDSALEFEVAIPSNAQSLHFDFLFSQPGDGDWMTLSFNDEVLYSFLGTSFFGGDYDEAVIPVSHLAGQTGVVRVILHPASSVATEVSVANFHFESSTTVASSSLGNISTRMGVGTGDNAMIGGFIITGTQPKTVLVRGIGPSLTSIGIADALADPVIEVYVSGNPVPLATNDNWRDDDPERVQHVIDSGLAPTNDLESAKWGILNPGAYTVVVRGKNNGTGIGLFEVYDLDQTTDSKLANVSTRGFVNTGDNVMIGGTIVVGSASAKVLVRAIGPSLTQFGVPGALADPLLELHGPDGFVTITNNNWRDMQEAEIIAAGIPPSDNRESAILVDLPPGNYTAIVRGSGNSTGIALVEAYQLQ